jgi:hypothetical protein
MLLNNCLYCENSNDACGKRLFRYLYLNYILKYFLRMLFETLKKTGHKGIKQ